MIRSVYKSAQLDIAETAYVEAHGTGTKVGDPIEAAAIASTFVAHVDDSTTDPVFIGSAKSNFGHLEGVSGILSLIKATMMLAKGVILPNANFENPNPEIPSIGKILKVRRIISIRSAVVDIFSTLHWKMIMKMLLNIFFLSKHTP